MKSFKLKMTTLIVILPLVICIVIGMVTYLISSSILKDNVKQTLKVLTEEGVAPAEGEEWNPGVTKLQKDVDSGMSTLKTSILILSVIILIISVFIGLRVSGDFIKPISQINELLNKFASGDLTEVISNQTLSVQDETGDLARSLNTMQSFLKELIKTVKTETHEVAKSASVEELNVKELLVELEEVSATTEELSAGSEETAASAQEMNASTLEVMSSINSITEKTREGSETADEISKRAKNLKDAAMASRENALQIYSESKAELMNAIEQSKQVNQIDALSKTILSIISDTNLLAFNASIEAARAGEAGLGFAVVAEEIRNLAENSKASVAKIQKVSFNVLQSVENLSVNAMKLLEFINNNVLKDYEALVNTSELYDKDAYLVDQLVNDLSITAENVAATMEHILKAINEVSDATNEEAAGAGLIAEKTGIVSEKAGTLARHAKKTKENADTLVQAVSKFKV